MDLLRWLERALGRPGAAPAYVTVRRTTALLPLLNCSGTQMVVEFPAGRRADAVAYSREIATFQAGIMAAGSSERRN